ncbi:glycosyltransferase, putative [Theileria equi strain WA]|uniref:Glycosyltransferase, putative n=1 Tax=Theileria equi strain WA TaxID=1537102 RepID=L0B281_THEEQ|nr:glycosyltransferase, putative [Theileria equi strain WA]AFZ81603.1 glycosyltransferase, putative [Theileria equi strain WA]|eukprot:XP_004831269.1 glycosyltransferase, putative [Theileria equi strain WA]
MLTTRPRPITVLIATEFFFPDIGGIETHVLKLSQNLIKLGFKVVVLTRGFGDRRGIRYMSNGLKVYHIPSKGFIEPCGLCTFMDLFPIYRNILIREQVDIIHTHQGSSRFKYEIMLWGSLMGYRTVFTDHSLFSFSDLGPAFLNEVLKHFSVFEDHIICVSNRHRENLVLRAEIDPRNVSVIGNALDSKEFKSTIRPSYDKIIIVVISRLTERKGIGLLIKVIPIVCQRHDNVFFIIGGDGPMFPNVKATIDKYYLHDRIKLLGSVPNHKVCKVLEQGHIFLSTSQTESFCIALLEAASCGLISVATRVGGVPEVLPKDMILLSEYDANSIADRIDDAIAILPNTNNKGFHERIKNMYSWEKVSKNVANVYFKILSYPKLSLYERFKRLYHLSNYFGKIVIMMSAIAYIEWASSEWDEIDISPDWANFHL